MTEKRATIKDVAREAGVSISTVSRYLNQNFSSMSKDTKERIESVIERLNYHPNKHAQGLKGQSRTIAVVVVNIGYPFCVSIIRSISDVLNNSGYSLIVCETGGQTEKEATILRSLEAQGVDGIIIQTNGANQDILSRLAKTLPVVLIDRNFAVPGSSNVVTNNKEASWELTNALFVKGYQEVMFVSETLQGLSTRTDRYSGYVEACSAHNKEPHVYWVDRENPKSFEDVVESLNKQNSNPIAVYTANGLLMLDLYPLLYRIGRNIPTSLGLATFDEPDWVKITTPSLMCIRQPTIEMGQIAANTILKQIQNSQTVSPATSVSLTSVQVIPSTLVLSTSTDLNSD
jgi:LacI family kdg operon repressor